MNSIVSRKSGNVMLGNSNKTIDLETDVFLFLGCAPIYRFLLVT